MLIIPAIDILGGRCARLTQGDYSQTKYYDIDPAHAARDFEQAGARRIHIVDLDAAVDGRQDQSKNHTKDSSRGFVSIASWRGRAPR